MSLAVTAHEHGWERWSELRVGDPSEQIRYWETLAQRQGWTVQFAEHVFREYRKFLFLALTGPITPPPPIRAAWDLHRELPSWRRLPESTEIERLLEQRGTVEQTRAAYIAAFDSYPPESIWPMQFRKGPEPRRRGSRIALALFVALVMGLVWCGIIPKRCVMPALAGTVGVIIACFERWNRGKKSRRHQESPSPHPDATAGYESPEAWSLDDIAVSDSDSSCAVDSGGDCSDSGGPD